MSDDAYDIAAEQSLLGSVLVAPTVAGTVLMAVPADAWHHPRHRELAAVLAGRLRRDQSVDPTAVLPDLIARHGFGSDTGPLLARLMEVAWTPGNADVYAERILHCAARRNLAAAATRLRQRLDQSWLNGEPLAISDFTGEMRRACDDAETADAGVDHDQPAPSLADLLAGHDTQDWLVPGLLERGERMVLTGGEGGGKSVLISQIAVCIAAGLHPFTATPLGRGDHGKRVLVIDCENSQAQSRRRYRWITRKLGLDAGAQDRLRLEFRPRGLNLLGTDAAWLERRIIANAPDMIVLGPLYRLHLADMANEPAARELVWILDGLRTRYRCAMITEAHPGHQQDVGGRRMMRPAGSSLFLRWPEFGFGLARAKNVEGEHPSLVDVVAWRGSREERQWPQQLRHGSTLPWEPAAAEYWQDVA